MSRINIVREIKQKKSIQSVASANNKARQREEGWNERFYWGKLPKYSTRLPPAEQSVGFLKSQYNNPNSHASISSKQKQTEQIQSTPPTFKSENGSSYSSTNGFPHVHQMNNTQEQLYLNMTTNHIDCKDRESLMKQLWEDLGVGSEYRMVFDNISSHLNEDARKEFIELEIESWKKLDENWNKLAKEIQHREKTIFLLKKQDQFITEQYLNKSLSITEKIYHDIVQTIKTLRIYSINVVTHLNKVREICSYSTVSGKYNWDNWNKNYLFDRNYLIKMRVDLDFLAKSSLSNYFSFAESSDPFWIALSNTIPINPDVSKAIRQVQYIIMQDLIYYQVSELTSGSCSNVNVNISNDISNIITPKSAKYEKFSNPMIIDGSKYGKNEEKTKENIDCLNRDDVQQGDEWDEISRQWQDSTRRINEIDKKKNEFIPNNGTGKQGLDHGDKSNKWKDDYWSDEDDIDLDIENERKMIEQLKREENERLDKTRKDQERKCWKEVDEKEKGEVRKENEKKQANKEVIDKDRDGVCDKVVKKEEEEWMNKQKNDEENEALWKRVEDMIKAEELKNSELNEDRVKHEKKESNDDKINIGEEIRKQETQNIPENPSSQLNLKTTNNNESTSKSKKIKVKIIPNDQLNSSNIRRSRVNTKTSHHSLRSFTPESHVMHLSESFKVSFFTGNLQALLASYPKYFTQIPEEQKHIFNINENLLLSISDYYNPKILLCSHYKIPDRVLGMCVVHFTSDDNSVIKVHISHLSTVNEISEDNKTETVIKSFIDYWVDKVHCHQIYIDLYYKYSEDTNKFVINTAWRDWFKTLNFRWVKLENLANHIRFQKMYYKIIREEKEFDDKMVMKTNTSLEHIGADNSKLNNKLQLSEGIKIESNLIFSWKGKENNSNTNETPRVGEIGIMSKYNKYMNMFLGLLNINTLKSQGYEIQVAENNPCGRFIDWDLEENNSIVAKITNSNSCQAKDALEVVLKDKDITLLPQVADFHSVNLQLNLLPWSNVTNIIDLIYYNRISKGVNILSNKQTKSKFYLFPAHDGVHSILIAEVSPELKSELLLNNKSIYEIFNSQIYNNLEQINTTKNQVLWVPSFSIDTHWTSTKLPGCEDINIVKSGTEYSVSSVDEYMKIKYMYDHSPTSSFEVSKESDDILIKEDFIFGVVNFEIWSSFNFSTVLLLYVTKEHLCRHEYEKEVVKLGC